MLKNLIAKRKYFTSKDPPMLTWSEKEKIRQLNKENPEDWPIERLAESFPATEETIVKVLSAKWKPKSVKIVQRYDERVKKNWALFRAGKLPVDDDLRQHLEKFMNRKIRPTDTEIIAKTIIKQKPVFPQPKSTLFSDIIQGYLNALPKTENPEIKDTEPSNSVKKITEGSSPTPLTGTLTKRLAQTFKYKSVTFDEFIKTKVDQISATTKNLTPEDREFVDEFKRRNTETYKEKSLAFENTLVLESDNATGAELEKIEKNLPSVPLKSRIQVPKPTAEDLKMIEEKSKLETGIIARKNRPDVSEENFPMWIKIPRQQYKNGVTYRVQDRYYDDDGEFLYRVPGLKT